LQDEPRTKGQDTSSAGGTLHASPAGTVGWRVSTSFHHGCDKSRENFWRFCDLLKRDVKREGRKWKRQKAQSSGAARM
jgi:hypothetical protein